MPSPKLGSPHHKLTKKVRDCAEHAVVLVLRYRRHLLQRKAAGVPCLADMADDMAQRTRKFRRVVGAHSPIVQLRNDPLEIGERFAELEVNRVSVHGIQVA